MSTRRERDDAGRTTGSAGTEEPGRERMNAAKAAETADDATIARLASLSPEERQVLLKVSEILKRLQFGTILLVVQDGKVVQIEMAEKFRLR